MSGIQINIEPVPGALIRMRVLAERMDWCLAYRFNIKPVHGALIRMRVLAERMDWCLAYRLILNRFMAL